MTISENAWKNYIKILRTLDDTAAEKMIEYVKKNGMDDMESLVNYAYGLATRYGEAAGAASAEMYEAIADLSGEVIEPAELAETATLEEVEHTVYGVKEISQNVEMLGSAIGRLVKMAGVDTTIQNAIRDGAEWAWIPQGDTCAFCIALASRGWQKASTNVLKNGHAEHIHANCDCTFAIRFGNDTKYSGYNPQMYYQEYMSAPGSNSKEKIDAMRREYYAENRDKILAQKQSAYARKKALASSAAEETFVN